MARRDVALDPLLAFITNGDVDGVKKMFRDVHVQGYEQPEKRHQALCAAIRCENMSEADRADIVRFLTCNIDGFDPLFEAGIARKNIVQIAFDERCYGLLPLLARKSQLEGCTFGGLLQSFKLSPSDALEAQAALGLADNATGTTSLHPLDLTPYSESEDAGAERDHSGRHYHYLSQRYLLESCHINAALLYRKDFGVVAVSRNSAFGITDGRQFGDFFPLLNTCKHTASMSTAVIMLMQTT